MVTFFKITVIYIRSALIMALFLCSVPFSTVAWVSNKIAQGFLDLGDSIAITL